ncbi:hypothetical protein HDU91_006846 [Kappamyces sp. JEL0680]|nr:hypothetical protein HDU91_006846 [Kappamyces sp. JEL0680]
MGMIISPKFAKKIRWINSLEALAQELSLPALQIPDEIHSYNDTLRVPSPKLEFGRSLDDRQDRGIPVVVRDCCKYIQDYGLETEGVFRLSGSKLRIDHAIRKWDLGCAVDLDSLGSVHGVCGALKQFFRELPTTLFPEPLYPAVRKYRLDGEPLPIFVKNELLPLLDARTVELFSFLFQTLYLVHSSSSVNRMPASNLAIVWTPNLIKNQEPLFLQKPENENFSRIISCCIEKYRDIWGGVN